MPNVKLPQWLLVAFVIVLVGIVAAIGLTRAQVLAAPGQPVPFSHRTHNEAEVTCLYCHPDALRSDLASIPSVQKCMGCHAIVATDRAPIKAVTGYWERGEPIPWNKVNEQPDFVFFTHRPHLGAGLSCETCHGDVGQMVHTHPAVKMDMGWCLRCHLQQPEENVARLADCLTCHK
jgi:hypothetical protein